MQVRGGVGLRTGGAVDKCVFDEVFDSDATTAQAPPPEDMQVEEN